MRGLDFLDTTKVFAGKTVTRPDERRDYGEVRWITVGYLDGEFVVVVWTEREYARQIISMRHGHDREEANWF